MRHKTAFYLFTLTIFVICLSSGCRLATSSAQVNKSVSARSKRPKSDAMPTGEYVSLVNTLPAHSRPQRITYNLVIHRTGPGKSSQAIETTFPLIADWGLDLYDCEFSPDRQFVSFKEGVPGNIDSTYQLLLWSRKTKRLWKVPGKRLCYPLTAWSPDSRKIAYIQGGDAAGDESFTAGSMAIPMGPIYLCVYDLSTGQSRQLARLTEGSSDFAWLSSGFLLYTRNSEKKMGLTFYQNADIEKVSRRGGPSQTLIGEGYGAEPSPSGRWIAFFAWPAGPLPKNATTGVAPPVRTGLVLYDTLSRKRRLIHPLKQNDTPDVLCWSPDSRRLWSIQITYQDTRGPFVSSADTKDHPGYGAGQITEIDIPTLSRRNIATLKTTDARARDDPDSQFRWVGISPDGRFLMVEVNEVGKTIMGGTASEVSNRIVAVSLKDGSVETLWNAAAANWRETPPQSATDGTRDRPKGHKSSTGQRGRRGIGQLTLRGPAL